MSLKIFHTGDLHIGMKFSSYPEQVRDKLVEARFETLEELVLQANNEQCNLFVIAGDLFDKINIPVKDILRVIAILEKFAGDCVLLIPGNHDYDNGMVELWQRFKDNITGNIVLLNEYRPYSLQGYDLDVMVYPAFCDSKHSESNRIEWINELEEREEAEWELGIAHGALKGLSPDMSREYFNVSEDELLETGIDLWLLGHTHLPFPEGEEVLNRKVFNAGTPEPDGLDCKHQGIAWFIEIDEEKNTTAELVQTGKYYFSDLEYHLEEETDLKKIKDDLLGDKPTYRVLRLILKGRIQEGLFSEIEFFYQDLRRELAYLDIDDSNLKLRITDELIDKEFAPGSFPYLVLKELAAAGEEDAIQLAYEMIKGVKE